MDFTQFIDPSSATAGIDPTDYQSMGLAAQKQRRLAEMLRQQMKDNPPSQPQMVGGRYIRPSWSSGLLDGLQSGLAQFALQKADAADLATQKSQMDAAAQWRSSLPSATTVETPLAEGDMGPNVPKVVQPTRDAILKYTIAGMTNPATAKEAGVVGQSLTSDLTRAEDMKFKSAEARQAALERATNLQAQVQARHEDVQARLADRNLDRASREALQKDALELRRQLAEGQQEIQRQGLEIRRQLADNKGNQNKPLPSAQATAYVNNNVALGNIDNALKDAEANPKAFGLKGMLPNSVLTRLDPKGVQARASIANLGSLKIHDRSGAAVTASETPRLLPFIPTPDDDLPTIRTKLNGFKREYNLMQQNIEDFAATQGYRSPRTQVDAGDTVDFGSLPK